MVVVSAMGLKQRAFSVFYNRVKGMEGGVNRAKVASLTIADELLYCSATGTTRRGE